MKMEPIVSSETSAIRTQTPGNYPKRNKLHLEHGESLKTRKKNVTFSYVRHERIWVFRSKTLLIFNFGDGNKLVHATAALSPGKDPGVSNEQNAK